MKRQHGLTLPELLVTLAVVVIVGSIAVPLVHSFKDALRGAANAQTIISNVLQNARAIAMQEGRYAGVRFQQDKDGRQCAIYVLYGEAGSEPGNALQYAYTAVPGRSPVQLPDGIAVCDMVVRTTHGDTSAAAAYGEGRYEVLKEQHLEEGANLDIDGKNINYTDFTSFTVIFGAEGQLAKVPCTMRCTEVLDVGGKKYYFRPGDKGKFFSAGMYSEQSISFDKVFNGYEYYKINEAAFTQDDYANLGLGGELSRVQFRIFDSNKYKSLDTAAHKFEYLNGLPDLYVNQFTGKLMGVSDD